MVTSTLVGAVSVATSCWHGAGQDLGEGGCKWAGEETDRGGKWCSICLCIDVPAFNGKGICHLHSNC